MSHLVIFHLDENTVLTVMDTVTNQTANTAGVNLHTSPLQTKHNNMTDHIYIKSYTLHKMTRYYQLFEKLSLHRLDNK